MEDFYRQKEEGKEVMQEKADLLRQGHLPLRVAGLYQADGFSSPDQVIPHLTGLRCHSW